jgi:hypothetical protein
VGTYEDGHIFFGSKTHQIKKWFFELKRCSKLEKIKFSEWRKFLIQKDAWKFKVSKCFGKRKSASIVLALFPLFSHLDHQFYTSLHFFPLFLTFIIKSSCRFFEFSLCLTGALRVPQHHQRLLVVMCLEWHCLRIHPEEHPPAPQDVPPRASPLLKPGFELPYQASTLPKIHKSARMRHADFRLIKFSKMWLSYEFEMGWKLWKIISKDPNWLLHWLEWNYPQDLSLSFFENIHISGFTVIDSGNLPNLSSLSFIRMIITLLGLILSRIFQ